MLLAAVPGRSLPGEGDRRSPSRPKTLRGERGLVVCVMCDGGGE